MTPPLALGCRRVLQSLLEGGLVAALLPGVAAAAWRAVAATPVRTSSRIGFPSDHGPLDS